LGLQKTPKKGTFGIVKTGFLYMLDALPVALPMVSKQKDER